jgi:8-hydroxy-5-deazaflavin:NADPH oxidoreductase
MTTIGLIGSGHIGSTVAKLAVDAGYDVVTSNSRGPETLQELVQELGPRARAATPEEAAAAADIVVVTIPLKAVDDVDPAPLAGKVVIDTCNYYPQRDGHIAELDDESATSSELVQAHFPDSKVVKAFNNIHFSHLAKLGRPSGDPERSVITIAGDDDAAKRTVADFLDQIGYDAHDVGSLSESWRFQPGTPAYGGPYVVPGEDFPSEGRPATAAQFEEALAKATREPDDQR